MNVNKVKPNGLALLPIIVFLILFIGIGVVQKDFYSMPAVIGFLIAPIFNALGRIDNSKIVVNFFIQEDDFKLISIIEEMKRANKIRRYLENEIYNEIEEKIQRLNRPKYIFIK